jgi:hypothetical protein
MSNIHRMQLLTDDVFVFSILEEAGQDFFDPTQIHLASFLFDQRFFLFLFCPDGKYKGCKLYFFPSPPQAHEIRDQLLPALLQLPDDDGYTNLRPLALLEAERLLHLTAGAMFFDAH